MMMGVGWLALVLCVWLVCEAVNYHTEKKYEHTEELKRFTALEFEFRNRLQKLEDAADKKSDTLKKLL